MGLFGRIFGTPGDSRESGDDGMEYTRRISPLIDSLVIGIFEEFHPVLLDRKSDYIIYAVWGVNGNADIDEHQRAIHASVEPVMYDIMEALRIPGCVAGQANAIRYLVKSVVIARINYMVERCKANSGKITRHDSGCGGFGPTGQNGAFGSFRQFGGEGFRRW